MKIFTRFLLLFLLTTTSFLVSYSRDYDSHKSCKNNCSHTSCNHSNCGHNSCKNNCSHATCKHSNCGHNSCKNNCSHSTCKHSNCDHNSCKNNCSHTTCKHSNCGHNTCKNNCTHNCDHKNCGHNSCKNDCTHTGCGHKTCVKLRLGNQVWNDRDGDGKRDPNEPSIPGAPISLYTDNNSDNRPDGGAFRTTVTDAQGRYLFIDLPAGRYIASMPILPGYQQSPNTSTQDYSPFPDLNTNDTNKLVRLVGPNGPGGVVYTNAITLSAGQEPTNEGDDANGNLTFDLAECGNAFIGDFVWNDLNGNGIQEANEPGINGVDVTITFPDGRTATEATHTYNGANNQNAPQFDGYYDFENLGPGTYKITFANPAGLNPSPSNQGGNDAKDSDPLNGSVMVTIAANQSDFTIDAGFTAFIPPPPCPNLSLGNLVFLDANNNGKRDANEQGISGLTVKLYKEGNGTAVSTIMTAEDGTYLFSNLSAGKYIVGVVPQSGYSQSSLGSTNPDNNIDNDNNGIKTVNGEVQSNAITLSSGDEPINDGSDNNSNLTLDFGLKMKAPPCTNHCDCKNDCKHNCDHKNCGHNDCKNDCKHTGCGHDKCKKKGWDNDYHDKDKDDHKDKDKYNDRDRYGKGVSSQVTTVVPANSKTLVEKPEITKTTIGVFPNPANNYFVLNVNAIKAGAGVIRVTDAAGKVMHTKNTNVQYGANAIKINETSRLKSGTYNVQLILDGEVLSQKLIMTK